MTVYLCKYSKSDQQELIELYQKTDSLINLKGKKLSEGLVAVDQKINKMLCSIHFDAVEQKGLKEIQGRIAFICAQVEKNSKGELALDCFGISSKVYLLFNKYLAHLNKNSESNIKLEPYFMDLCRKGKSEELESKILAHRFDLNRISLPGYLVHQAIKTASRMNPVKEALNLLSVIFRAGAEPNSYNDECIILPPLHTICLMPMQNKTEILKFFLENGADPNFSRGKYFSEGEPLSLHLGKYFKHGLLASAQLQELIRFGLDINLRDKYGNTPLSEALQLEQFDLARQLVFNGINVDLNIIDKKEHDKLKKWMGVQSASIQDYTFSCPLTKHLGKIQSMKHLPVEILEIITQYSFSAEDASAICKLCDERLN